MQTEQTLIDLGFADESKWYCEETNRKTFSLLKGGKKFIAVVHYWENPQYVSMGIYVRDKGKSYIVDRWRDCFSTGSIERKINIE